MDSDFKPPEALSLEGNPAENWRRWRQRFELYLAAKEATEKADSIKIAMLLSAIGPEVLERYNHFTWDEGTTEAPGPEDRKKYKDTVEKFEKELSGMKRVVFSRYKFWEYTRGEQQPFEEYLTQLKVLARACEFSEENNMIRDKIVFQTKERPLKERLLRETELDLEKTVRLCTSAEITQKEIRSMKKSVTGDREKEIDVLFAKKPNSGVQDTRNKKHSHSRCSRCGQSHAPRNCPAWGQTCNRCQGPNHFKKMCKASAAAVGHSSKREKPYYDQRKSKKVNEIQQYPNSSEDEFFIDSIDTNRQQSSLYIGNVQCTDNEQVWYSVVQVARSKIKFKLDTGAAANILPYKTYKKIQGAPDVMRKSKVKLTAFGGHEVGHLGVVRLQCSVNGREPCDLEFFVTSSDAAKSPPILGLEGCKKLALIQRVIGEVTTEDEPLTQEKVMTQYKSNFEGLGRQEPEYDIKQHDNAEPHIDPPRKVPLSLYQRLKIKLGQLCEMDVLEKEDGPTEWVNSLVIVEKKDGSLRLCLDPSKLNKTIKREHFMIPTLEDVRSQLGSEKKKFSVLDQRDSFWQVVLSKAASKLCTFNTPFGRYRFKRMPFGICSASEVLQKRAYDNFADIEGVHVLADDMLIAAENEEDHDRIFRNVMARAEERGVKFNEKKLQFKKSEVVFSGNRIGAEGMKPDELKIKAILDMPRPESKEGIWRLIGLLNYLAPYIPDMSSITSPLRALLKKGVDFQWSHEQETALEKIKDILCSEPVLCFFDEKKDTVIQADSSSTGLGASLIQEGHPVAYASRSLSETEQRWSQIEKEMLAIVFATERFHHYIYGRPVEVHNDHKPLETIMKKSIHKATPRLQVMMMKLMRYDLTVKYVPGSKLHIADTLSRAYSDVLPPSEDDHDSTSELEERIHSLEIQKIHSLPISKERLESIRAATKEDQELSCLIKTIESGWPRYKRLVPVGIRSYWAFKDQLSVMEGLVFKEDKLVIPSQLRPEMLNKIHEAHLGMEKCKARARGVMYWPGMCKDIDETVAKCATCNKYQRSNQKEPLKSHPIPPRPWAKVGSDILEFGGKSYLVLVDYFSKWPEVSKLEQKTAKCVISHMKTNFARYGIPENLVADNMPYGSAEMKQFADDWGFTITTSSPRYPQSNGQSENTVGLVKQLMRKAYEEGRDPHLALLAYRNTPVVGLAYSPSQLLNSRMLRDKLPVAECHLMPQVVGDAAEALKIRQMKQKKYFDRGAKSLRPLDKGDSVRIKSDGHWKPAVVTAKHSAPRSYMVMSEDGGEYRRNRKHLLKTAEPVPLIIPEDPLPSDPLPSSVPSKPIPPVPPPEGAEAPVQTPQQAVVMPPMQQSPRRSMRQRHKPVWLKDYTS